MFPPPPHSDAAAPPVPRRALSAYHCYRTRPHWKPIVITAMLLTIAVDVALVVTQRALAAVLSAPTPEAAWWLSFGVPHIAGLVVVLAVLAAGVYVSVDATAARTADDAAALTGVLVTRLRHYLLNTTGAPEQVVAHALKAAEHDLITFARGALPAEAYRAWASAGRDWAQHHTMATVLALADHLNPGTGDRPHEQSPQGQP